MVVVALFLHRYRTFPTRNYTFRNTQTIENKCYYIFNITACWQTVWEAPPHPVATATSVEVFCATPRLSGRAVDLDGELCILKRETGERDYPTTSLNPLSLVNGGRKCD